jgi:hypothetical protein
MLMPKNLALTIQLTLNTIILIAQYSIFLTNVTTTAHTKAYKGEKN